MEYILRRIKKALSNFYLLFYSHARKIISEWNDKNGIQLFNNCYNYACNILTGTFAQPGRARVITFQK